MCSMPHLDIKHILHVWIIHYKVSELLISGEIKFCYMDEKRPPYAGIYISQLAIRERECTEDMAQQTKNL